MRTARNAAHRVYPRECGGTDELHDVSPVCVGLSPRVRGNRGVRFSGGAKKGSIPASAGEPVAAILVWRKLAGLSPRVRGNRDAGDGGGRGVGSIPASAGEPSGRCRAAGRSGVYPRECGGTFCRVDDLGHLRGLSPRVRGNPYGRVARDLPLGSIPASAGEPVTMLSLSVPPRVYPRECGGTPNAVLVRLDYLGLSPRVRGNLLDILPRRCNHGSIPASAGEPAKRILENGNLGVYPRECGGTSLICHWPKYDGGLSPRVRGNRGHEQTTTSPGGSIPASAGEPRGHRGAGADTRVYPRECGGTIGGFVRNIFGSGLSPRVRGNRRALRAAGLRLGSIPASAGEPSSSGARPCRGRVYPRECGGTTIVGADETLAMGLSPRVRGNRTDKRAEYRASGSIPASAGEPAGGARRGRCAGVYPRECGGTFETEVANQNALGLSPRVRGNPPAGGCADERRGSIPASAGEPASSPSMALGQRVYPRECGGT